MIKLLMHATDDALSAWEALALVAVMLIGHGFGILISGFIKHTRPAVREWMTARGIRTSLRLDTTGPVPLWWFHVDTASRGCAGVHQWKWIAVVHGLWAAARPLPKVRFE